MKKNQILNRVISEIKETNNTEAVNTTSHGSFVSGVFEDNEILNRVVNEIKETNNTEAVYTTSHSSFVSGIFKQ